MYSIESTKGFENETNAPEFSFSFLPFSTFISMYSLRKVQVHRMGW